MLSVRTPQLLHLDEEYRLFEGVTRVADLCAAPGQSHPLLLHPSLPLTTKWVSRQLVSGPEPKANVCETATPSLAPV